MVGRYYIKLLVNFLGEAMNPLFFNKTKQQAKTPEPNFDVSFVNLSNQLCAAINNLTGNMVLINKVESLNSNQQVSNNSRLQPFYGATIKIKSHSGATLGFSVVPNQTLTMQQLVVKTPDKINYYGGKSQQVEKSTRVKARVKAHALREIITAKEKELMTI